MTPSAEEGWSPRSPVFIGLCAVVMAVPLAVLGQATGPYDDPKAWALPILVAVTALGWLARLGRERAAEDGPTRVLRWTIVAYLSWWLITTVTSIAPGQSVVGNFGRGMGLLTVGAAALLFFLVRSECRTREAVCALIDAALLGSAPVCLLALGQAMGWDPLPRAWDPAVATLKVRSTFGQHIFLSSYLVILVPLGAARLDATFRRWWISGLGHERGRAPLRALGSGALWVAGALGWVGLGARWAPAWWALVPWGIAGALAWAASRKSGRESGRGSIAVSLLAALVTLQVLVVVLSGARGPLLGLLFGLSVAGLALLAHRRAWKVFAASAVAVAALLVALALLNVPHSPLRTKVPALQRLGQISNARHGTPVWFRLQVWRGIVSGWGRQLRGEEIVPGTRPWVRSALGYGLETQLLTLDQFSGPNLGDLRTRGEGWGGSYLVDRSHNVTLDHLVTGGLIGAALWFALVASLLAVAVSRTRRAGSTEQTSLCFGCIGAILAHLAEGQVGIETPMSLGLFWIAAGVLAGAPWSGALAPAGGLVDRRLRRSWWAAAVIAGIFLIVLVAWANTRWLLASVAYADGTRHAIADRMPEALADFRRSRDLLPWLPLPAEALAYTSLRLAAREPTVVTRLGILHEAEAALVDARRHALGGGKSWTLTAEITFAEVLAGERSKLAASLEAFDAAARLRPGDGQLLSQWAWALLEARDPARARAVAEKATAQSERRDLWLAWAMLARAARDLGDEPAAQRAAGQARRLAPPDARRLLESLERTPG